MRRSPAMWCAFATAFTVGALAAGLVAASAGEPPPASDLPGDAAARLESRWIAPYVATVAVGIGPKSGGRTVWYGEDGAVLRDVLGGNSGPGFVLVPASDGSAVVHGTRAEWSVALPPPPPTPKFEFAVAVSEDGRTFLRQQTAPDGTTTADVFVDGSFKGRLGPFERWRGTSVVVGDDGSAAIAAPGAPGTRGCRVIVWAPDAKPSFEAACSNEDAIDTLAPGGRGALLRRSSEKGPAAWLFASPTGLRPLDLGVNAHVVAWVPASPRAVVASGPGDKPRLRLIDLETGTVAWDVEDQPLGGKRSSPGAAVEGDLVLVAGLEAHAAEGVSHWRRRVDALDLATGARVAVWRSMDAGPVGYAEAPTFRRRRGALFLVAPDQFAAVPLADVRAKTNRWE